MHQVLLELLLIDLHYLIQLAASLLLERISLLELPTQVDSIALKWDKQEQEVEHLISPQTVNDHSIRQTSRRKPDMTRECHFKEHTTIRL